MKRLAILSIILCSTISVFASESNKVTFTFSKGAYLEGIPSRISYINQYGPNSEIPGDLLTKSFCNDDNTLNKKKLFSAVQAIIEQPETKEITFKNFPPGIQTKLRQSYITYYKSNIFPIPEFSDDESSDRECSIL